MAKYKKRKDGRFRARVWDGSYIDGKKHYIDLYSTKSSRDLELKVIEYETEKRQGLIVADKNVDIYDYSVQWVKIEKAFVEGNTKLSYKSLLKRIEDLRGVTFENLNYRIIQNTINDYSNRTASCQHLSSALKRICISAERDKLLPKGTTEEIFERVVLPKHVPKEKKPISDQDKEAIKNSELEPVEQAFLYLLYFTGMRRNEVLALTTKDITDKGITVNKALGMNPDRTVYLKEPKSKRGIRTIPIPNDLKPILDSYIKTLDEELLFSKKGKYYTATNVKKMWYSIQRKTHIKATPHCFRHNYCTMLCYQAAKERNITTKKIAELLGDTEEMVLKVYSHIVEEQENVSEAINNAFGF